jgi:hypothetical protein
MKLKWIRLIGLLVFGGTSIGFDVYGRYVKGEEIKMSYSTHILGALAGFFIGLNVLRNLKARRWEVILDWFLLIIYILLMGFAIIFNIVNERHYIDETNVNRCDKIPNQH